MTVDQLIEKLEALKAEDAHAGQFHVVIEGGSGSAEVVTSPQGLFVLRGDVPDQDN